MPRKKSTAGPLRLVAYYRYSGGSRQTEQSIEGQRHDCEAYARAHGMTICKEYIDRHISGKTDSRPAFQQMIADSDRGVFDAVICWKTDRLARNRYDSAIYKSRLRQNGVKILYAAETVVDGPEGIILEGLMESLAEYYSAELSQKLRRGQRESAMKCIALGGNRSFGYDIGPDKHYCINPAQAPSVRYIFEQYAAGHTAAEIVAALNAKGVRTSRGHEFNKNSILRIITNEMYLGVYKYGDIRIEGGVPAMINRDLFKRCQQQLAYNRSHNGCPGSSHADYLLSGKLFCAQCRRPMRGISGRSHTGEKYCYYACPGRIDKQGCTKSNVEKTALENAIVRATVQYILAPEKLDEIIVQILDAQARQPAPGPDPEKLALEAERKEIRKKQDHLLSALENGSSARLVQRLQDLEQQEAQLSIRLAALTDPPAPPKFTREQLEFMLSQFQRDEDEQPASYRRRLLDTFVSSVLLSEDCAIVRFNLFNPSTGDLDFLEIPFPENKNPAESDDSSSNSAGSTALRLVEAMGVEPMSEKSSVQVSPGAGDLQHSRRATPIVRLALW